MTHRNGSAAAMLRDETLPEDRERRDPSGMMMASILLRIERPH